MAIMESRHPRLDGREEDSMTSAMRVPKLCLVGALHMGSPDDVIPFLHATFPRLAGEVKHHGIIARQIQYASGTDEGDYIHFLGMEVDRIEDIPEGMMAWQIDDDSWSVLQPRDGVDEVIWQTALSWEWLDLRVPGRPCGEFSAEWLSNGISALHSFRMVSNSYIGAPADDDIRLVEYDPAWPWKFEEMKERLLDLLGLDVAIRIEHYGSTSIPGMPAKPVIDILVEIPSFGEGRKRAIPAFNAPEVEYWRSDHMRFYMRDGITGTRTHHLHMAPAGHRIWEGLAFRDYLRAHPDDASRYVALKYELADRHRTDREAYTNAKAAIVRAITDMAQRGSGEAIHDGSGIGCLSCSKAD